MVKKQQMADEQCILQSETAEIQENDGTFSDELSTENNENSFDSSGTVGIIGSAAMVVNAALGAGMLNFPYAFYGMWRNHIQHLYFC